MNDLLTQLRERIPFILAVAATTLWIVMVFAFVRSFGGINALMVLQPADLAVLIAAFGGPLAALWLFMAVMEQRRIMTHFAKRVTEMMMQNRQSLQQTESQTRTLMQLQHQSARAQAIETRKMALQDMAANVSVLAERLGVMNREMANAAWARYGAGDVNVFVQSFLSFAVSHPDISERMAEAVARDSVAGTALAAFVRRYERLATATSDDKMAGEILDDGALGRAYRLFKNADEMAQRMMAQPAQHMMSQPAPQPAPQYAPQPVQQPAPPQHVPQQHVAPQAAAQAAASLAALKAEAAKAEAARAEPPKSEAKPDVKSEVEKPEPVQAEPVKTEMPKPALKTEAAKTETTKAEIPGDADLFGHVDVDTPRRRLKGLSDRLEAAAPPA